MSLVSNISTSDYSHIFKILNSPKAKEELFAFQISVDEEKKIFIGNKEFYKFVDGYVRNMEP